jgi:hypothetical protein
MATRSSIHSFDGTTLTSVYCHWDGYPSHHAPILLEHINTPEKVSELLSNGNISSLGTNITTDKPHTFDNPQDDVTIFYGRDRGETEQEANITTIVNVGKNGLPTAKSLPITEEYQYLYDLNAKVWYVMNGNSKWNLLTTEQYND